MLRRFGKYLIGIKLFFLCLSIYFLVSGFHAKQSIDYDENAKVFTVDLQDSSLEQRITEIDEYLTITTGQAIGLAIIESGVATTLLPATTDYAIYRTYLHSINGESKVQGAELYKEKSLGGNKQGVTQNVDYRPGNKSLLSTLGFLLFCFLALFL